MQKFLNKKFFIKKLSKKQSFFFLFSFLLTVFIFFNSKNFLNKSSFKNTPSQSSEERINKTGSIFKSFFPLETKHLNSFESILLKERIEKDLKIFNFIKDVKLSIPNTKEDEVFEKPQDENKISVIIEPYENKELSSFQVESIIQFILGNLKHIKLENIFLSDNQGFIYTPHYLEKDFIKIISQEKQLKEIIANHLNSIIPKSEYFFNVHNSSQNSKQINISVNISSDYLKQQNKHFSEEINSYLKKVLSPYKEELCINTKISSFTKPNLTKRNNFLVKDFFLTALYLLASFLLIFFAYRYLLLKSILKKTTLPVLQEPKIHTSIHKLIKLIKLNDSEQIALILSYLNDEQAESFIEELPTNIKEHVLTSYKKKKTGPFSL